MGSGLVARDKGGQFVSRARQWDRQHEYGKEAKEFHSLKVLQGVKVLQ